MPNARGMSPIMQLIVGTQSRKDERTLSILRDVATDVGEMIMTKDKEKADKAQKKLQEYVDMAKKKMVTHDPFTPKSVPLSGAAGPARPAGAQPISKRGVVSGILSGEGEQEIDWRRKEVPEGMFEEITETEKGATRKLTSKELKPRMEFSIDEKGNVSVKPGTYQTGPGVSNVALAQQKQKESAKRIAQAQERINIQYKNFNKDLYNKVFNQVKGESFGIVPSADDTEAYSAFHDKVNTRFVEQGGTKTGAMKEGEKELEEFNTDIDTSQKAIETIKGSGLDKKEKEQRIQMIYDELYKAYPKKKSAIDSSLKR